MNEGELRDLMYTAQLEKNQLPFSIRYPRGEGTMPEWRTEMKEIKIGTGRKLKDGEEIAILAGHPFCRQLSVVPEGINLHIMTCFAKAVR
jgi:1-deoxy-D-xylulose-5-phosphate synthase